jgi:hypothetical protein
LSGWLGTNTTGSAGLRHDLPVSGEREIAEIYRRHAGQVGLAAVIVSVGGVVGTFAVATKVSAGQVGFNTATNSFTFLGALGIGLALTAALYAALSALETYARLSGCLPQRQIGLSSNDSAGNMYRCYGLLRWMRFGEYPDCRRAGSHVGAVERASVAAAWRQPVPGRMEAGFDDRPGFVRRV